jgi:hypothetical protein
MLEQLLEISRKATESSLQMQNVLFKSLTQDLFSTSQAGSGASEGFGGSVKKRSVELTLEALNKHREQLDSSYRAAIQTIEQALHVPDAKSPEDLARAVEDVWRRLFDVFKTESETQFRELHTYTERWFETVRKAEA